MRLSWRRYARTRFFQSFVGQQLVDAVERLRRVRGIVERGVELVGGEVDIAQLVARDHRGGVVEARAVLLRRLQAGERVERLDRGPPHPQLGPRFEQLVQQHARADRELEALLIRVRGRHAVLEPVVPEVADLFEQLRAPELRTFALGERVDLRALGLGDGLPLAALAGELDHRFERRLVQRIFLERAAERAVGFRLLAERARRDAEPVPDLGDLAVGHRRAVPREDLAVAPIDFFPLLGRFVGVFVRLGLGHQHVGQADRGFEALGLGLDGEPVVPRRFFGAMQLFVRASEHRLAPARHFTIQPRGFGVAREHLEHRQRVVPALRRDQAIRDDRAGFGVIRIELEHALVELERLVRILELVIGQLPGFPEQRDALAAGGSRDRLGAHHHLDRRRPARARGVQAAERGQRGEVFGIERDGLVEVAQRGLVIAELVGGERSGFGVERRARVIVTLRRRVPDERVDRAVELLDLDVQPRQHRKRGLVVLVDREHFEQRVDRAGQVGELALGDLRPLHIELDALRGRLHRRDMAAEHGDELAPAAHSCAC